LLNKEFPEFIAYLNETYGDRVYDLFFITNGTILPKHELLQVCKNSNCWFQIDDYTQASELAAQNLPIIERMLTEQAIHFKYVRAKFWYDMAFEQTDNANLSEEELMQWRDDCDIYLQTFSRGLAWSCCRTAYATTAGIASAAQNDFLDLKTASQMEILEFRLGYTVRGYVEMCKWCRGVGKNAKLIPPAVQISKRKLER
jgi:hypothetical protein